MDNIKERAMNLSLMVAAGMLIGKLSAYFLTDSTAILSDAAESVVHIFATAVAAFSVRYAERPADLNHPYGHGRIVIFSVGLEGLLIVLAAVYIIFEASQALIFGPQLKQLDLGLLITAAVSVVNLFLGLHLIRVGRENSSPVVEANGHHILTDMWTSVAVVVGVGVVWLTGIVWLDPVIAMLAALNIIRTGSALMRNALSVAMDEASPEISKKMENCLDGLVEQELICGYHELRHRLVNDVRWVELHVLVPGDTPLDEAHERATKVELALVNLFDGEKLHVTSHIEPCEHDEAHPDGHFVGLNQS